MSLFEWWFESSNPGPVGDIEVNQERVHTIWLPFTLARFALTCGLFIAASVGAAFFDGEPQVLGGVLGASGFLLYLVLGYFIRPRPDLSNMGYFGGLFDNPFRYSDDLNRILLFFSVLLLPGYLLAQPIAEIFAYIAGEAEAR